MDILSRLRLLEDKMLASSHDFDFARSFFSIVIQVLNSYFIEISLFIAIN